VISFANTDGEANLLSPGIGVGGHCTPVYPYFLIEGFRNQGLEFSLGARGREINDAMAAYAVELVEDVEPKTALILGLGFRPDVKEDTFSTAYLLRESLVSKGFQTELHDPHYTKEEISSRGFSVAADVCSSRSAVIFLVTCHSMYQSLDWRRLRENGCRVLVDGRNLLDPKLITAHGIRYVGIGR